MLQAVVPKLFTILSVYFIKKLNDISLIKELDIPVPIIEKILLKYTDILCIQNKIKYYIPYHRYFHPTIYYFKEQSKVLVLSFTHYKNTERTGNSSETFLSAMMTNIESSNFIYHSDKYSSKSEFKSCTRKILSKGIFLFQKFNKCEPERIIIYFDNTESHAVFNSIESLEWEKIIESLITPPQIHFISICDFDSDNTDPTNLSFMFLKDNVPDRFQKLILYCIKNYHSNTNNRILQKFTQILCRYTGNHTHGKMPLIVINLKMLESYDEVCENDLTTVHEMDLRHLL